MLGVSEAWLIECPTVATGRSAGLWARILNRPKDTVTPTVAGDNREPSESDGVPTTPEDTTVGHGTVAELPDAMPGTGTVVVANTVTGACWWDVETTGEPTDAVAGTDETPIEVEFPADSDGFGTRTETATVMVGAVEPVDRPGTAMADVVTMVDREGVVLAPTDADGTAADAVTVTGNGVEPAETLGLGTEPDAGTVVAVSEDPAEMNGKPTLPAEPTVEGATVVPDDVAIEGEAIDATDGTVVAGTVAPA